MNVGSYAHGRLHKDSAGNEVIKDAKFDKEPPKKATKPLDQKPQETPAPKAKQ